MSTPPWPCAVRYHGSQCSVAKTMHPKAASVLTGPVPSLVVLALTLTIGPVEGFGWRGLMWSLRQRRMAPIRTGLLLGLAWSLWHFPAFLLSGMPQGGWSFLPFVLGSTAISVTDVVPA